MTEITARSGESTPHGPAAASRATELPLTWVPTSHYRRLVSVALLPLLAAVVFGRPGYLVLAAPVAAGLALAARRPSYPARVAIHTSGDRCFEGEEATIGVEAQPLGPAGSIGVQLTVPAALALGGDPAVVVHGGGAPIAARWQLKAQRWGRWESSQIRVTVRSRGGLFAGTAVADVGVITVFPQAPSLAQLPLPAQLHTRIGDHVDRLPGEGVEFAGVRPFTPGDRLRRINWPVTSRRGTLHVNQLAAERAVEIITVIDALTDTGPAGNSTLDRAVRGAAGIAWAYTRAGDRVGVITLYGPLTWITPGSGQRQFFRIVESVLEARNLHSFVSPDLTRIPPAVLPRGALVVMFSPLLDERAIEAVTDLRERGYAVIVTDVLATAPVPPKGSPVGQMALRVWRLERQALRYRLESAGIPVVGWPGVPRQETLHGEDPDMGLDVALGRFARLRVRDGLR